MNFFALIDKMYLYIEGVSPLNLRQLEFFKTLADTEHMTQTAAAMNTTQPNLSHAMSELEKELGVALFEKAGRNIRLTKYGRTFYDYVTHALGELDRGQQVLQEMIHPEFGHIDFGFIYTMGANIAPQLTREFQSLPKNDQVSFSFYQGNSNQMLQLLKDEKIDIALSSKVENDDSIHFDVLLEQEMVLIVSEKHPLKAQQEIYLSELQDYPFVYFNQQSGLRSYIDDLVASADLVPNVVCEVEEDHTMLGFVGYDYGIAIMPNIPSISSYPVKKIKIKDARKPRHIYLAIRKNSFISPVVQRFYDFCLTYAKNNF